MNKKCRWWVCRPYARWWNDHRRVLLYRGEGSNPTLRWCMGTTVQNCQFKHVETRFVWCIMVPHPEPSVRTWWDFFVFSPRSLLAAGKFSRAGLFYWAASRHRLCLYWPVSRCAFGKEGVKSRPPYRAGSRLVGTAELVSERSWPRGGRSPSRLWWVERSSNRRLAAKEEAAAWVRRADQRDTRADVVAARRAGGLDLALAWASMRIKLDASLLHLPPTSMPRTTKRHRRLRRSSG